MHDQFAILNKLDTGNKTSLVEYGSGLFIRLTVLLAYGGGHNPPGL